jgi:hypothetical protein
MLILISAMSTQFQSASPRTRELCIRELSVQVGSPLNQRSSAVKSFAFYAFSCGQINPVSIGVHPCPSIDWRIVPNNSEQKGFA